MKKTLFALFLLHCAAHSHASPKLEGEYLCDDCQGYLTVKANKANSYKVWLGVSGGSCGGEVFVKSDAAQAVDDTITLTWKLKKRTCRTKILVKGKQAFASDSCLQSADEEDSTCAVLGGYTKRDTKN